MCKAVRDDKALTSLLQGVVADIRGCVKRLFNIATFKRAKSGGGLTGPNAGKAIGLQLQPN